MATTSTSSQVKRRSSVGWAEARIPSDALIQALAGGVNKSLFTLPCQAAFGARIFFFPLKMKVAGRTVVATSRIAQSSCDALSGLGWHEDRRETVRKKIHFNFLIFHAPRPPVVWLELAQPESVVGASAFLTGPPARYQQLNLAPRTPLLVRPAASPSGAPLPVVSLCLTQRMRFGPSLVHGAGAGTLVQQQNLPLPTLSPYEQPLT